MSRSQPDKEGKTFQMEKTACDEREPMYFHCAWNIIGKKECDEKSGRLIPARPTVQRLIFILKVM